jgi:lysophospholipase L1-like esterase
MEISMPLECEWKPLPVRKEKPVIVYGTSIAQGGCASRPGLAWTNILARKLNTPVVNLGFSGNGRLEKEILDLMAETDAKAYVLDCLPNLMPPAFTSEEVKKRIEQAVRLLRKARPNGPILLTEHDGYTDEEMNEARRKDYTGVNKALQEILNSLRQEGFGQLYLLSKPEINQDIETMVDGVHPNDIGMMRYADAYEKILRRILDTEDGGTVTTTAVTQRRDARIYDWEVRHQEILEYNKVYQPEIALLGNSITHFWGGLPANPVNNGKEAWNKHFGNRKVVNMGFGWDRVENVLWRVHHGTLDGFSARQIVLMIGTNNLHLNTDDEIVAGLDYLIRAIQSRQPRARILLLGILPRRNTEERVIQINKKIAGLASGKNIQFADTGPLFIKADHKIEEALFTDGLHPNEAGYDRLGGFIARWLDQ